MAWSLVTVGGSRLLPGRSRMWHPPLAEDAWGNLLEEVAEAAGEFDIHTVYQRPDKRQGLAMVLVAGDRSVGFVKARSDDHSGIDREEAALGLAERSAVRSFVAPRLLGSGTVAGWRYIVLSPMPPRMHRMPKDAPSQAVHEDIRTALSELPSPADPPTGWEPSHGDFAPWNLRQIGDATPWLVDWESVGWAPPGADQVFYGAAAAAVGRSVARTPSDNAEAVSFWSQEVERRNRAKLASGLDLDRFDRRLLAALRPVGERL